MPASKVTRVTRVARAQKAAEMAAIGVSQKEIAKHFDVSSKTVFNWIRSTKQTGKNVVKYAGKILGNNAEDFRWFYERFSGLYFPEHWGLWVSDYFDSQKLLINCPPRHGKSKLFSVWLPIFEIARNP